MQKLAIGIDRIRTKKDGKISQKMADDKQD